MFLYCHRFTFIAVLLSGLLGGLLYLALQSGLIDRPGEAVVLSALPDCDPAQQSCTAGDSNLMVKLRLSGDVKPLQPFNVQVELEGATAGIDKVTVRFDMVGMDMGMNRFNLSQQVDNLWQGQAMLPICSHGRRDWQATVEVSGKQHYQAVFELRVL